MAYASSHGYVVLTQDLDFGAILAATHSERPSVVQIRSEDLSPARIGKLILNALRVGESDLQSGALLTVDFQRIRMRLLPFPQK